MPSTKDILTAKGQLIHSIHPDATVYEAIEKMANNSIGALIVMEGEKVVGILSERDYARKVILMGRSSKETKVSDIMTRDVVAVSSSVTLEEAMAVMSDKRIRHLPVVDGEKLVGILSIGDLVRATIEEQKFVIKQLADYITR